MALKKMLILYHLTYVKKSNVASQKGARVHMKLKKFAPFILSASALIISGCSSTSVDAAASELNTQQEELTTHLNELFESESNLQTTFEDSLANDPELTTFSDGSASVFENIEQRSDLLNTIEDLNSDMRSNVENLAEYEGENLDNESVQSIGESYLALNDNITEYTEAYSTALESQESYFDMIGSEEATYQEFTDGINTVNEEQQTLQDTAQTIDDQLVELQPQLNEVITATEEASSQEG